MASTRRPFGPPHGAFDFRDMFFDSSKMEEIRNVQARSLGQMAPGQSRILKRNQTMDEKYLLPKEEALAGTGVRLSLRPPTISSKSRASEALRKLAQIETKILKRRQVPTAWSGMESDSTASERSLPQRTDTTSVSSQYPLRTFQKQVCKTSVVGDDGQSGKGSRFLKKKELPAEARSPVLAAETEKQVLLPTQREPARKYDAPDSDEEEMKVLLGSLMESSGEKERNGNQELPGTRSDLGKVFLVTYSFVGFKFYILCVILGAEPRALFIPSSCSASELYLRPNPLLYICLMSVCTPQVGMGACKDRRGHRSLKAG